VMRRGGTVRMGGKFVEFGGSSMGIARHTSPHLHFSSPRQVGGLPLDTLRRLRMVVKLKIVIAQPRARCFES
jgi:hypothetical protein